MQSVDLFSQTYTEARQRFLDAACAAGAQIDSRILNESGPEGEELAMDFAVFGPGGADAAIVVVSGTHGPEGYCGSACQLGWMSEPDLFTRLSGHRLLLVHAHNPYGFAWMRRTDAENIDLNRNYVDFSSELPGNPGYAQLQDALAPEDLDDPQAAAALAAYEERHGKIAYMAAMMGGQRIDPNGLFFGGTQESWSNRTMTEGLRRHLAQQRTICLLDIHTGLGPYGVPYLVHGYPKEDPRFAAMHDAFGDVMRSTAITEEFDEDLPVDPQGPIVLAMDRLLPGKQTYAYVCEFGTYSTEEVLGAHRADNWLHAHGDFNSAKGKAIKSELRRVMYPEFDDWKQMIWEKARWCAECMLTLVNRV
ncbi:MAG: M14 family metallopeptidase [Gammaproteobacteria bacterium]|nr:M14 family metallopeptidase [Gammaproteobacteria bacterium]MDE0272733.1 M14 family metallopeptidase [Gammaproteobacteria bacterium]